MCPAGRSGMRRLRCLRPCRGGRPPLAAGPLSLRLRPGRSGPALAEPSLPLPEALTLPDTLRRPARTRLSDLSARGRPLPLPARLLPAPARATRAGTAGPELTRPAVSRTATGAAGAWKRAGTVLATLPGTSPHGPATPEATGPATLLARAEPAVPPRLLLPAATRLPRRAIGIRPRPARPGPASLERPPERARRRQPATTRVRPLQPLAQTGRGAMPAAPAIVVPPASLLADEHQRNPLALELLDRHATEVGQPVRPDIGRARCRPGVVPAPRPVLRGIPVALHPGRIPVARTRGSRLRRIAGRGIPL